MPPLAEFPDSAGAHRISVFSHTGPADYAPVTDTPVAGGDVVNAVEAGLKYFDIVLAGGLSDSGTYRVEAVCPAAHPSTNKQAAHARTWLLRWVVVATGAEAAESADLDAEVVRLFAVGRY